MASLLQLVGTTQSTHVIQLDSPQPYFLFRLDLLKSNLQRANSNALHADVLSLDKTKPALIINASTSLAEAILTLVKLLAFGGLHGLPGIRAMLSNSGDAFGFPILSERYRNFLVMPKFTTSVTLETLKWWSRCLNGCHSLAGQVD